MGNDALTRIIRAAFLTTVISGAGTLLYGAGGSTHVLGARRQALSNADDIVNAGIYSTTTLHAVDADLAVANIKQGTTIFGFTGTYTSDANATAGDILLSKTAYVNGSKLTGTIVSQTLSAANDTVNSGVYSATTLHAEDADLAAGNIAAGVNIFGFAGTYTGDANATAGDLLLSKVAYANGSKLTGIITNQTLSAANDTVAPGIYAGTTLHAVDADLAVANIKPGATLFGFSGTCTADGTATAGDIVASKTAYVNNVKLTGTKTTVALDPANDTVNAGTYLAATLHAVDADLAVGNIAAGKNIFGFAGTYTSDANAAAADILNPKTAYVNGVKLTGALSLAAQSLSAANDTVNGGTYSATTLHAVDADLAAGNIAAGVNMFGFTGTYAGDATATAGDLLLSKIAYANGSKLTGIITNQTLSAANDTVAPGIYAGTTLHAVDADLAVENIKPGATLFGFSGTCTADGTATAGDIVASKTAYVNNVKLTGTKATAALDPANDTVNAGTYLAATLHAVDADLAVGNIAAGKNIFGFAGTYTSDASAAAADILNPQTAYVNGVKLTGTLSLAAQSLSAANDTVNGGTYSATTLHAVDADLAAVNIKSGVNIFGFVGVIALPDTGQTTSYAAGDDAAYNPSTTQKYFVDNGNGTITDNRTGLMWKKCSEPDATTYCIGAHNTYTWANAITQCEGLSYASQGDWRLPNAMELFTIVTQEGSAPLINATYFPSTVSDTYWTSTSYTVNTSTPLSVGFDHGDLYNGRAKTETGYVRCVRGGP